MDTRGEIEQRFKDAVHSIASQLNIPEPDADLAVKDALLKSAAFARSRRPVIAVTGVTHTGKSSLINTLFEEKKLTVGLTTDTTDLVMRVQFESGLLIYDTPGGGGEEYLENITRAFLKIDQLKEDVDGNVLPVVVEIPTADINTYRWETNSPRFTKTQTEFEEIDLIVFVVSVETGIRGDDRRFYNAVASSKKPVVVVINKIDLAHKEPEKVQANIGLIERKMHLKAIPISAQTGDGLDKLANAIHHNLPLETSRVLGETVDSSLKKIMRHRQVDVDSIVSAIKSAELVKDNRINDIVQFAANVLGLYGHIVSQYMASELELAQADIDIAGLWRNLDERMTRVPSTASRTVPLVTVGLTFGAIVATVATGGLAAIPIAIGAGSGLGIGGAVGITSSMLHRSQKFESALRSELDRLKTFAPSANRLDTAASVLGFGRALRVCCSALERKNESEKFPKIFEQEFNRAFEELKPFTRRLNSINSIDDENRLIKDLVAHSLKIHENES